MRTISRKILGGFRTVRILVLAAASAVTFAAGPVSAGARLLTSPLPLHRVARHSMPVVDVQRLLREDSEPAPRRETPRRVGHPMASDLSPANSGTWEELPDGNRLWRLRVSSEDALWIVLGFGTFRLQPGGRLWIYDAAGETVLGPFTASDVREHGQLWTPPIPGDGVVLELLWPARLSDEQPNLHLGTVSHGYKDAWGGDGNDLFSPDPDSTAAQAPDSSGSCNVDVNCPAGDDFQGPKRSVVQLLSGGFSFCSGALINTTANDCRPYLLTARHCVKTQSMAAGTTFRFNYERPGCESGSPGASETITGSTLLASYGPSDFTLLELDDEVPESFDAFFSGWSRSGQPASRSWGIHHPSGDVKKISRDDDPLVNGQSSGWGSDHWRVSQWELGTTEGGSSGSPLFDLAGRIVGQLHGGAASCAGGSWDEYGKLAVSWTGGGSSGYRLRDWLDPTGSSDTAIDGIDLATCHADVPVLSVAGQSVSEIDGNSDGVADPGETLAIEVSVQNEGELDATSVEGTLTAVSPLVSVPGPQVAWPPLPAGSGATLPAAPFSLTLDEGFPCGDPVVLLLQIGSAESAPATVGLEIWTGAPHTTDLFVDDMEGGAGLWTGSSSSPVAWERVTEDANGGSYSWFVEDADGPVDATLVLPTLPQLHENAILSFHHRYDTENNRDGGVLEYATDGATEWQDAGPLIVVGGYDGSIDENVASPLASRPAWAGDSDGWVPVEVDLTSLAGRDVRFRWRFAANDSIGDVGWYLDDLAVRGSGVTCAPGTGRPVPLQPHFEKTPRPRALLPRLSAPALP